MGCGNLLAALLDWVRIKTSSGKLLGFVWYTIGINHFRETDLFYPNKTPKPVYYVWKDWGPEIYLPIVFNNNIGNQAIPGGNGLQPLLLTAYPPPPTPYP
jgi:hypothetical protein